MMKIKLYLFPLLLNTGIQILLCSVLSFSLSADSYHYFQIAERFDILNIKSLNPDNRSVGYPLFLYFLGTKDLLGGTLVIILQCIMAILIPILIFIFLSNNDWKIHLNVAKILALFISIFHIFITCHLKLWLKFICFFFSFKFILCRKFL